MNQILNKTKSFKRMKQFQFHLTRDCLLSSSLTTTTAIILHKPTSIIQVYTLNLHTRKAITKPVQRWEKLAFIYF